MQIDIQKITEGKEFVTIRYKNLTPTMKKVIGILEGTEDKLWGKNEAETVSIRLRDLLYLESVDGKLFAYTGSNVLRIEGRVIDYY